MKIKIVNRSRHELPEYSTNASAGMDLRANIDNEMIIKDGERICQMIISKHEKAEWVSVETLEGSNRGAGGFGHTGKE